MNRNNSTNLWARLRILLLLLALSTPLQGIRAAGDPAKTKELIAILGSQADLREKSRACKDAAAFGTVEIVPVLAGLLSDEQLAAYARGSLEIIPEKAAIEALRTALGKLEGKCLVGVINSLGNLRDEKSAPALRKLAAGPGKGVATPAMMALGRIADAESIKMLRNLLKSEPAGSNGDAALACLLASQRQLQLGNASLAQEICDDIIASNAPLAQKVAAVRGSIVARKEKAGPFVLAQLKSENPALRDAALVGVREIPSKTAGAVLKKAFKEAKAEERQLLLQALVECDPPSAREVARANLNAEDSGLRITALKAFSRSVGPADCETLIASLERTPEESAIAYEGLARMTGAKINSKILASLDTAATPKLKASLIDLLADRYASNATPKLLELAAGSDKEVKLAACRALRALAKPQDLPALITLAKSMPQGSARTTVGIAIASVVRQAGQPASEKILAEYNAASDNDWKKDWGAILISVGYQPFLPIVQALIQSGDPALADSFILKLGRWPNPAPVEILLPLLSGTETGRSRRALTAIVELAVSSIEEKKQPLPEIIALFQQLQKSVKSVEEKRLVISGIGNLRHRESIKMLAPYYDDKEVRSEATAAILSVGDRLRMGDAAELVVLLQRMIKESEDKSIRARAEYKLSKLQPAAPAPSATPAAPAIPTTPATPAADIPVKADGWVSLFDGKTLTGWEGNTDVWRVEDGVIKAGSMNGNPRNEFLVSTRPYKDFIFELEYLLVGTQGFVNGGVQFRSVRKPPNEMIGYQADIGAGYTGSLWDESRRGQLVRFPVAEAKQMEAVPGWKKLQIRCQGPRIQLFYEGRLTADYTETKPEVPAEGFFGPQIHGGCKAVISYRNIRVQEIAPAGGTR